MFDILTAGLAFSPKETDQAFASRMLDEYGAEAVTIATNLVEMSREFAQRQHSRELSSEFQRFALEGYAILHCLTPAEQERYRQFVHERVAQRWREEMA